MKLLYIIVNSKSEEESSSRKVSRKLVDMIKQFHPQCEVEEINLYEDYIPRLDIKYFRGRNCSIQKSPELSEEDNKAIERIHELADQFAKADAYVIGAPLWSMSFPSPLKEYIDCIVQHGKTIELSEKGCKGLLDDKERRMIYVQSSGGPLPMIIKKQMNYGVEYVKAIAHAMGIAKFEELLIDGTGFTKESKVKAEEEGIEKILPLLKSLRK